MKYLLLITGFVCFNLSISVSESIYTNIKKDDFALISPPSLAERYYDKLEVKTNFPMMLNDFLDRRALVRTDVPPALWQEIKESINYAPFRIRVVALIPEFYTNSELQRLLNTYNSRPKVPITKLDFRKRLGQEIDNFTNLRFITTVNSILSENGYNPL